MRMTWEPKKGTFEQVSYEDFQNETEPFEDKWGEQWIYSGESFMRLKDKFVIKCLNHYNHSWHSVYEVKMDEWCRNKREEIRGWDYLD